jgi:uncharacterized Zn-finger protein
MDQPTRPDLKPETTMVETRHVWCDGSGDIRSGANFRPAWLGHPRIFMQIDEQGYVDCGYCDRRFILEGGPADPAQAGSAEGDERRTDELQPGELSNEGPTAID